MLNSLALWRSLLSQKIHQLSTSSIKDYNGFKSSGTWTVGLPFAFVLETDIH